MYLVYFQGVILAPDYQRHWVDVEDCSKWLEEQGFDLNKCHICPVVIPEVMGSS